MLTFLFWNIDRKNVSQFVADLAVQHAADFVLLAECALAPVTLLQAMNRDVAHYHYIPNFYQRVMTFVRFSPELTRTLFDGPNLLITNVNLPGREEFLIAAAHLPSRLREDSESLSMECQETAKIVRQYEERLGHERTIVIGDLNLNPFEPAMAGAAGFHAVSSKRVAARRARVVHGRRYPFFYNPMWNHFGDETPPAGTYYYRGGGHLAYFWNIFDQVLVRPDLVKYLPASPVEVVTSVEGHNLLRGNELPNRTMISDHLPILFKINM